MFNILGYISLLANWPSILLITIAALYFFTTRNYNYWKSRGVNGPKPFPLIGNVGHLIYKPRCQQMFEDYKKFGKIYGIYEGSTPILMVAEPELIKEITIKNFHKFVDRGLFPFGNELLDRSLLNVGGEQWKHLRVTVSPTFSSGKMKKLHKLIESCVKRLDNHLEKIAKSDKNEIVLREVMSNYTMDVIALCAFATKIDTHSGEMHPFVTNAKVVVTPNLRAGLFFVGTALFPSLVRKYKLSFLPSQVLDYFKSTLKSIMTQREAQKDAKYVDFLQLLLDEKKRVDNKDIDEDIKNEVKLINESMKKKSNYEFTEIDMMATSLFFILAGSETTSTAISHLLHELALNPKCQQKLYEEIKSCEGNTDYDTISQLTYLDACVNETLRKYPAVVFQQRTATEDHELGDTGLHISKGMATRFPMVAIQHDPNYFPDPEQFDPERFMPENRSKVIPFTFNPFGNGPRNCIGMRFALMNVKTCIVNVLAKYRFSPTENTITDLVYKKFVVLYQSEDMGSVRLELRN